MSRQPSTCIASDLDHCERPGTARFGGAALLALAIVGSVVGSSHAATVLFSEDFEGYTSFPSQIPSGDFVNPGLPKISEGADEHWYGARFQAGNSSSIDADLAVQKIGGGTNGSHTGRFEDDAGLMLHISTQFMDSVTLSFDWRTFLAETGDRIRVGYYVGNLTFSGDYANFYSSFGSGWFGSSWTQLLSGSASNAWQSFSAGLPVGHADVWVAFWMDNGEGDYAKIDNVLIEGTQTVPEPSTVVLTLVGAVAVGVASLRRRR
jgi:hypothetical protein